jgi:HPt (histidine-containing phosphotransfer) domain-containing protein
MMKTVEPYGAGSPAQISQQAADWTLPETIRELADGGATGLIVELIEAFRADTASRLGPMREAIVNEDIKKLNDAAHTIKGSAQQMGADAMAFICQELEQAAMNTPASKLMRRLTALEAEFAKVSRAMSVWTECSDRAVWCP